VSNTLKKLCNITGLKLQWEKNPLQTSKEGTPKIHVPHSELPFKKGIPLPRRGARQSTAVIFGGSRCFEREREGRGLL